MARKPNMEPLAGEQWGRVVQHIPLVRHILARRRLLYDADAYDAGLDGLIRAARHFDPSRGLRFTTLAYTCVRNEVDRVLPATMVKSRRLTSGLRLHADPRTEKRWWPVSHEPSPAARMEAAEEASKVKAILATLPDRTREVVARRFLDGCQYADIARRLGLTTSRACQIAKEGLAMLRRRYAAHLEAAHE